MNKLTIALLRRAILEYEISIIRGDSNDEILKKLADISNACDSIKIEIDSILKKKR